MGKYSDIGDSFLVGETSKYAKIGADFEDQTTPTAPIEGVAPPEYADVGSKVARTVAGSVVTPIASGAYGALRLTGGLMARGENLEQAMTAAGKTLEESSRSIMSGFVPEKPDRGLEGLNQALATPFEPAHALGGYLGDAVLKVTGSPALAAGAATWLEFRTYKEASGHGLFGEWWRGAKGMAALTGLPMSEVIKTSPKKLAQRVMAGDYPSANKVPTESSRLPYMGEEIPGERPGFRVRDAETEGARVPYISDEFALEDALKPKGGIIDREAISQFGERPPTSEQLAHQQYLDTAWPREATLESGMLGEVIHPPKPTGAVRGPIDTLLEQRKAGSLTTQQVHEIADSKIAEARKADDMYSVMAYEKLKRDTTPAIPPGTSHKNYTEPVKLTDVQSKNVDMIDNAIGALNMKLKKNMPSAEVNKIQRKIDALTEKRDKLIPGTLEARRQKGASGSSKEFVESTLNERMKPQRLQGEWERLAYIREKLKDYFVDIDAGRIQNSGDHPVADELKSKGLDTKGIRQYLKDVEENQKKIKTLIDKFTDKPKTKNSVVDIKTKKKKNILDDESGQLNVGIIARDIVDLGKKTKEGILEFLAAAKNAPPHLQDLLLESVGKKQWMLEDSQRFWNGIIKTAVPDALDRQAIVLYTELKGDVSRARSYLPQIEAKNPSLAKKVSQVIDRMEKLSPEAKHVADTLVRQHYDATRANAVANELFINYKNDYINRVFKRPGAEDAAPPGGGQRLGAKSSHQKERTYETVLDRMAEGGTPYTLDVAELGVVYDAAIAKAVMHSRLLGELEKQGYLIRASEEAIVDQNGVTVKYDQGKTPYGWRRVSNVPGYGSASIHPDAFHIIRQYVDTNPLRDFKTYRNVMKVRAMSKQMILSLSPFHYWNLAKDFVLSWTPQYGMNPKEALGGGWDIWKNDPETVKSWVESGMIVDSDASMEAYRNMARATIGAKSEAAWGKAWDKMKDKYQWSQELLWRKFVPSLKITNAELQLGLLLKKNPNLDIPAAKKQIAELVNRKYGLLNWEAMGTTPIAKEILANILLAPDWTVSNFMYAKKALDKGSISGKMALRDWSFMVVEWQILTNALNYAALGHSSWSNPDGYEFKFAIPWRTNGKWGPLRDDQGRIQYADVIAPGSVRDISRAVTASPTEMGRLAVGKANPMWKGIAELGVNLDFFANPIMNKYADRNIQRAEAIGHIAKSFTPIPVAATVNYLSGKRTGAQFIGEFSGGGMVSKGPSKKHYEEKIKYLIEKGRTDEVNKVLNEAAEQGHMIRYRGIMRSVENKRKYEEQRKSNAPYRKLLDALD